MFNKNLIVLIPPQPIKKFIYLCDNKFHPTYIKNLYDEYELYGAIIIKGDDVEFYNICGTIIKRVERNKICLPNRHRKGGQSSKRFERLREENINHYINYCEEMSRKLWINDDIPTIKRLLLFGCADKRDRLYKILCPKLKIITERITCEMENIGNIYQDYIKLDKNKEEKKEINIFLTYIRDENERAIYGKKEIMEKLEEYMLEKIIIDSDLFDTNLKQLFEKYNCEIIVINENCEEKDMIKKYGGIVGITWY